MSMSAFSPVEQDIFPDVSPAADYADRAGPRSGRAYEAGKRLTDLVGAVALLLLSAPILAAIALAVKLTSPGPVLFRHRRLGRDGRGFACLKFRTMVRDAVDRLATSRELSALFDANFKIKSDPRGTSLDELPQLWNVVRGDMSLVGPRPIVESELARYGPFGPLLLTVKPGLGGLWQVSGRSDTTYPQRVAMDVNYIETRTLAGDLRLLAMTALVVIRGRGAY